MITSLVLVTQGAIFTGGSQLAQTLIPSPPHPPFTENQIRLALLAIVASGGVLKEIWASVKRRAVAEHLRTHPQPSAPAASSNTSTSASAGPAVSDATHAGVGR